ncbi:hypothetical protein GCM10009119_05970 [Algoriphagus jejuensis]|uniref:Uncharacterized protein n=1 Tax=Algoriphagus jejuensis TaxID=419934 RepID=A0ABN1MWC7_9BACT
MRNNSFLSYYKTILEKVSFDNRLVEKEYWKAKQLLKEPEAHELDNWMINTGLIGKISVEPIGNTAFQSNHLSRKYLTQRE